MAKNGKIRWGIMGCASIARRTLIPAIQGASNGTLLGIASRDPRKAKEWAARFDIPKAYAGYQALLNDPDIDAVYIPLPNHLHAEWTVRSAAAGKHVLCEKPMAMNAAEAARMIRAADRAGVVLMEAFMYRFHPQIDKALRLIRSGAVGEVRAVHAAFSFPFKGAPEDYRWRPETGGGALYDVGCYPVSAARLFYGAEPSAVFARARFHPELRVDMTTSLILEFPGDRFASIDCSFETQFQSRLEVVGSDGRLWMDRAFSAKLFDVEIRIVNEDTIRAFPVRSTNQYTLMIEHFGRSARSGKPVRYPASDALRNMTVIDAAFKSLRTGRRAGIPKG
jgi:D-xylose 1-dehydrogenase (NADP+, D-xylono-1,5-lactone-forming)